jgi:hypothetical protein
MELRGMTWVFSSTTGDLTDAAGTVVGHGFSGHGVGLLDPEYEMVQDVGPIPRGSYVIGPFFDDPEKGPLVANLVPHIGTDDFGRTGFMIHGDTAADVEDGTELASEGCIVLARSIRELVAASGDNELQVV